MSDPNVFCLVDDKHIPIYRIIWISEVPHFCGEDDCQCEGMYEIRLEQGESVWGTQIDRDAAIEAVTRWHQDPQHEDEEDWM